MLPADTFTLVHVALSLIGIFSGLIVLAGLLQSNRMNGWTLVFLITTVATSVTGFFFPFHGVTPAIILGILSLVVLLIAIAARTVFNSLVVSAIVALYFNFFVLVVQSFLHIPALHVLANGSEPPFAIAQGIGFGLFLIAGIVWINDFIQSLPNARRWFTSSCAGMITFHGVAAGSSSPSECSLGEMFRDQFTDARDVAH